MTFRMWMQEMIRNRERRKEEWIKSEDWAGILKLDEEIATLRYLYEEFNRYPFFDTQK